jgi:hypothetical protein
MPSISIFRRKGNALHAGRAPRPRRRCAVFRRRLRTR